MPYWRARKYMGTLVISSIVDEDPPSVRGIKPTIA